MAYIFSFADNATYSALDINAITKRLVTSGIEDSFADGVAYNVSRFNEAGKLLYTSGVVPEDCFTLKVIKTSDTEILINPGTAFFDDGATITIKDGGETLALVPGFKNYVYLKNELVHKNICYPYCGTEEPSGDCVILAEIDESGVVSDKRTYARGKVGGYQSLSGEPLHFVETVKAIIVSEYVVTGEAEFDIGNNNFEYILVLPPEDGERSTALSLYRISDGQIISFYTRRFTPGATVLYDRICLGETPSAGLHYIQLSFLDGVLKVKVDIESGYSYHSFGDEIDVRLNLIFF